jgi:hypothetical protein
VKFEMKVNSIVSKDRKENLYRVEYTDGDVMYWTTSKLCQKYAFPIELIHYFEENTGWGK